MEGKLGGQWNKIFMGIFRSTSLGFLHFLPPCLNRTHSGMV